ncbi:MAG: SMC-Scp complex subunit ScpB [Chitinophagales bacterium]|nr:SMC-Scp complex subunit ScpB [Chitinophagales bacterium]
MMTVQSLRLQMEALVFTSTQPLTANDLYVFFEKLYPLAFTLETIEIILNELVQKYQAQDYPFEIIQTGGGYQFLTKPDLHLIVAEFQERKANKRLTTAAMETLAIIAYKQPVSKGEVEHIRGVNSDYTIQKLMEKELVEIVGRSEEVGKPLLYGTSAYFMDYFGINDITELPKLKEFEEIENQIGEKENIQQTE